MLNWVCQKGVTPVLAILSAMEEENALLRAELHDAEQHTLGRRNYHIGSLFGQPVIVVFSHWGKVAAASTVTALITRFNVSEVVFTGVAGAVSSELHIGDIVVANQLYQHDMDVRPILPRHTIPLLGQAAMDASQDRIDQLKSAATAFLENDLENTIDPTLRDSLSLSQRRCVIGGIASGDQFISSSAAVDDLRQRLPGLSCVEMEGGAVAQVCTEFDVPFSVVRTISDSANESAGVDFPVFIEQVASQYSFGIIKRFLQQL